jgi:23S rRNA pseudouridine2605 synthase
MLPPTTEKLQKVLARRGLGSRREIEQWIIEGRVEINNRTAQLGDRASATDTLKVNGRVLPTLTAEQQPAQVLCYHKPVGEICTRSDPEGRPTVFDNLPRVHHGRWVAIGRLDINTSGLLLFTTDGELANKLMHPAQQIEREYAVRVLGKVEDEVLETLQKGVQLEDGEARFTRIREAGGDGANHWYHVVLTEGRQREVRRLWEAQGVQVSRLIRIRYGTVPLPRGLRTGHASELSPAEVRRLLQAAGIIQASPPPLSRSSGPPRKQRGRNHS